MAGAGCSAGRTCIGLMYYTVIRQFFVSLRIDVSLNQYELCSIYVYMYACAYDNVCYKHILYNSHGAPMNPEDLIWNGRARTVLYNYYSIYNASVHVC